MNQQAFVDHYEILQLNPTADNETIERVFRLLAKRYHPDNGASGDIDRFNEVRMAYEVLSSPEARAAYDVRHDQEKAVQWQIFDQGTAADHRGQDQRLFHGILSLLYVARRRAPETGGLPPAHLEKMLATPREHLEFPLWYLKKRGLVEVLDTGLLAITIEGIEHLGNKELWLPSEKLLAEASVGEERREAESAGPRTLEKGQDAGEGVAQAGEEEAAAATG